MQYTRYRRESTEILSTDFYIYINIPEFFTTDNNAEFSRNAIYSKLEVVDLQVRSRPGEPLFGEWA